MCGHSPGHSQPDAQMLIPTATERDLAKSWVNICAATCLSTIQLSVSADSSLGAALSLEAET